MHHDGATILLVEDNPDDVALTLRAFEKNKIKNRIVVANDGAQALDYLFCTGAHSGRDPNDKPQLVLLDLKLPKLGGLEVLERIRSCENTRRTPVVILTSSKEEFDLARGYDSGANSYVVKPVDFSAFVEAARTLGFYWVLLNEIPN
jgi:two-component system, response regulator